MRSLAAACLAAVALAHPHAAAETSSLWLLPLPAIHGDTIVFTAEGDLARRRQRRCRQRLTTHPAEESRAAISPDGKTIAFSAAHEGPTEVYTVSIDGGVPVRQTYEEATRSWSDGPAVKSSTHTPVLDIAQLPARACQSGQRRAHGGSLAQASDGFYDQAGRTLYFTRLAFQGSYTKRYQGGTAQNVWRFAEATKKPRH